MKTCEFRPSNLFYPPPHNVEMYLMMNESEVGGCQQQTILPCQVRMALGTKLKQNSPLDLKTILPSSASTSTKSLADVSLILGIIFPPTHPPTPNSKSILALSRLCLNQSN